MRPNEILKFTHNMGADGRFMYSNFGAPGHMIAILEDKNPKKEIFIA